MFLGDTLYGASKNGRYAYNLSKLKQMIEALQGLDAAYFLISHDSEYIHPKDKVMSGLMEMYAERKPGEAYLYIEEKNSGG